MNSPHTHYDTLMVSRNASPEVIRAAFRSLSQKYHPDKNNHPDANRIMQQFNESYKILSDPIERSKYDKLLTEYEHSSNDKNKYDHARACHQLA
jgi:DnaJ-class molecular chaperone